MHTQSDLTHATNTLAIIAQFFGNLSSEELSTQDVTLLEFIAQQASGIAQDARATKQSQLAMIEEFENQERYGFDVHAACGH